MSSYINIFCCGIKDLLVHVHGEHVDALGTNSACFQKSNLHHSLNIFDLHVPAIGEAVVYVDMLGANSACFQKTLSLYQFDALPSNVDLPVAGETVVHELC